MGYAGGTTPDPTYRDIGDHTETLQVDYDPALVSYPELLAAFWDGHRPDRRAGSRQYMSAVFVHDDAQRRQAEAGLAEVAGRLGRPIHTRILPFAGFTRAEDYHQKYHLRGHRDIYREVRARFDHENAFIDSLAAARINGFLGGYGSREGVAAFLESFQLSAGAAGRLRDSAGSAHW